MALGYSDLEVYHGKEATAPETAYEEKIPTSTVHALYDTREPDCRHEPPASPPPRLICGLRAKFFWLMICGITLAVIGAAVGGAIGGIQASKASPEKQSTPSSSDSPVPGDSKDPSPTSQSSTLNSSSDKTPASTTIAPTLSTSTAASPTQTLYRDCPSSNNTIYNGNGSSAYQFRKICNRSYKQRPGNVVNEKAASLDDCIDLCVEYNVKNKSEIASGTSSPCNSVCWRNSLEDPDWPGQCFGSTIYNSSAGFEYNSESICDSGAWINQNFE